jgi:FkbM family methyltransferase
MTIPVAPVPLGLRLRHRIATSAFAGPAARARQLARRLRGAGHPELGLLRQEDAMIDAALGRIVKPDWTCIDVGGHLGSVAHRLQSLAPDGALHIVEASPAKAAMLAARFPAATIHPVAVSDVAGDVSFFENLAQPGFSSLANREGRGATREIRVEAVRLDDLLADLARVDFIKVDVEGFELAALRGCETILRRDAPVILFEAGGLGDPNIDAGQGDALFAWLTGDLGYDVFAAFDLHYGRPALTADGFASYRRYPFLAFNYFAMPRAPGLRGEP